MNGEQLHVSVIEPLSPAIERVKTMLFRPFDLGKWFVIGFCAWLAELGNQKFLSSGAGGGGGRPFPWGRPGSGVDIDNARDFLGAALNFIEANLLWILPLATIAIVLWVVMTWLSSRGRFMFLHCVVENKAEVAVPWNKFSRHADSLFIFRLVLDLITLIALGVAVYTGFLLFLGSAMADYRWAAFIIVVAVFITMIAVGIVVFLIKKFTTDFVVPIMFLRLKSCPAAWREFLVVLSANAGHFTLYILFQIAICILIVILILATVLLTCCVAAIILAIPYIGTVFLLPIYVFHRSYTLHYLRQFGSSFDVFGEMKTVVSQEG